MASASEIDALFKLPAGEFTAARNALAARLKKAGRTDEAARVKELTRPTATAWAVNQVYWLHPKDFDRLVALDEKVRKAQASGHPSLRDVLDERRKLISELTGRAETLLAEAGHGVSPDATRRMTITLESLASWGRTEGAPQPGRLTADLEPLGFDGLAALLGGKKLPAAKVLQFRSAKQATPVEDPAAVRARAREAVAAAEKTLRNAQRDAERAQAAHDKATTRAQEAETRYAQAREEARVAASEARKTAQAVADAQRALEKARASVPR